MDINCNVKSINREIRIDAVNENKHIRYMNVHLCCQKMA